MPSAHLVVESEVNATARVAQLRGLFDIPQATSSRLEWNVELPLDEHPDWSIGLIVGPSGSGKSTVARGLWPEELRGEYDWPADRSVVDAFPAEMGIKEIAELLSSVGFSSPPSWLRPYGVLSTGEQFRVSIARGLAERRDLFVVDEFTSTVDRTVAQIGSAAVAKTIRRRRQRMIAVTCHEDVEAWLAPDWTYRPAVNEFRWECLQRRPAIDLRICRVPASAWRLFAGHHYLDGRLHPAAQCFAAFLQGAPVAFCAWLPQPGPVRNMRRITRLVCLPDFQGVGIGSTLMAVTTSMWRGLGARPRITSTHPAVIAGCNASAVWAMTRKPSRSSAGSGAARHATSRAARATRRLVASFQYVGEAMAPAEAGALLHSAAGVKEPEPTHAGTE